MNHCTAGGVLVLLALTGAASAAHPRPRSEVAPQRPEQASQVVQVASPTGEVETDRASILAALDQVQPGGTVQFAPGAYMVGEGSAPSSIPVPDFIEVPVPGITLVGHPEGTTIRGCDRREFGDIELAVAACNGLALTGQRQTIRGLTFEHMWQALWVGCCLEPAEGEDEPELQHVGGHLVEGNTFRASVNGFRVIGDSPEPVVVRDNDFVNVWHAGGVNGRTAHILDNRISVTDAGRVPPNGFPGLAIFITAGDTWGERGFTCAGNVVAGNRIDGHPEGIAIEVWLPDTNCRDNVIRDNTIRVSRVRFTGTPWGVTGIRDASDSTLAGVPIMLADLSREMAELFFGQPAEPSGEILVRDNLVEGNRIAGAEGVGIEVLRASGNRIVGNQIAGIIRRDPFPGNTMYIPPPWPAANGSGIWVSPGSEENQILGNTFEDVASAAVFLEGDRNLVVTRSDGDEVRDLGTGNRVTRRGDGADGSDAGRPAARQASETVQVAAPTGEMETDRARILAALEEARPGGTVQFAPGTYLVGEMIRIAVPGITLQGNPEGTTIRGCEREEEAERLERSACQGFELVGGNQTVRGFTFEQAHFDLVLGCCIRGPMTGETPRPDEPGGYLIEDNEFRNSRTGVRVIAGSSEPTVIRDNVFRNTGHAVGINSGTVHVLDNDISAPEPERIPGSSHTLGAIGVAPTTPECGENVIAGNRIEGHPDGISVTTILPGVRCLRNVIRDNTILVQRVPTGDSPLSGLRIEDEADPTLVGVPLFVGDLSDSADRPPLPPSFLARFEGEAVVGDHLIEGNRILGAEGIGIEIRGSSRNRIVGNTVSGIEPREPFPGNLANSPDPEAWRHANGSGIWISAGSDENQILGNTFEDIASAAVFLEGDRNLVVTASAEDEVRDLGSGNRVTDGEGG